MTDYKLNPNSEIEVGTQVFKLDASFETLAAIQETLKEDIVRLMLRALQMRQDEVATVIAIASKTPRDTIGALLTDMGASSSNYAFVVTQLMTWLSIATTPKPDREKKTAELRTILARLKTPASPGTTTSSSPSASSDGLPAPSGAATSGSSQTPTTDTPSPTA